MTDGADITRKQFLGGVAGAGAGGLLVGGVAGGFVGNAMGDDEEEAAPRTAAGAPAGGSYLIGSPYPTSGPYAADGEQMRNGTQLAIDEINAAGGIAGRMIERIVVDTDVGTPEGVTTSFNRLIDEGVDAIVGGYVQIDAPVYDIVPAYGAPYLHGNTLEEGVARVREDPERYSMIFNVDPTEVWYGRGLPRFLDDLEASGTWSPRAKTVHVVEGDLGYSQTISRAAQPAVEESGYEVLGVENVVTPISEWGPVIGALRSSDPVVVFNAHPAPADLAAFMQQFAANPTDSLVYLQYGPSIPQFLELAGDAANGVIWSTVVGGLNDDLGRDFQRRYQEAFNAPAGFANAPQGYDTIHVLARAWAMVSDKRDFEAVSDQLRTMRHRGVTGTIYMNNPGQFTLPYPDATEDPSLAMPHVYFQIQEGEHRIIYPPPYADAEFQSAPWMSS